MDRDKTLESIEARMTRLETSVAVQPKTISIQDNDKPLFGPDDPNRDADWDWTEDVTYTLYYRAQEGSTSAPNVELPYYTNIGPAGTDLTINRDFRREDGWVLLYRDFGTETRPAILPMYLLYNRFRGLVRWFYFNTLDESPNSYAIGTITQGTPSRAAAVFNFGEENYFLNDFDEALVVSTTHAIEHLVWNYVDFPIIGYDDNLPTDAALDFKLSTVNKSNFTLDGTISLDQVLEKGHVSTSKRLFNSLKEGFQFYKTADGVREDLQKKVDDPKNSRKWWKPLVEDALSGPVGAVAPELAAVVGVAKAFFGSTQVMPLKFAGELQLTGTIEGVADLHSFQLRMPGAPRTLPDEEVDGLPLYDLPLGLFNLIKKPRFLRRILLVIPSAKVRYRLEEAVEIITNPHVEDAEINVQVGLVFSNLPTTYTSPSAFLRTLEFDAGSTAGLFEIDKLAALARVTPVDSEPVTAVTSYAVHLIQDTSL